MPSVLFAGTVSMSYHGLSWNNLLKKKYSDDGKKYKAHGNTKVLLKPVSCWSLLLQQMLVQRRMECLMANPER